MRGGQLGSVHTHFWLYARKKKTKESENERERGKEKEKTKGWVGERKGEKESPPRSRKP